MGDSYDAADIRVTEFDQHVRTHPGMYFGASGDGTAGRATRVLCAVLDHALHPAAGLAPTHTARVEAEILGDLTFRVADDQVEDAGDRDWPRPGYYGALLGPCRWIWAAAAAVSARAVVEVWREGRGFRQELRGLGPLEYPRAFDAPAGTGTRVLYELDGTWAATALSPDLAALDRHAPHCGGRLGPGGVTLRDLRAPGSPVTVRLR
ncbi:hypothetical protein [Streptomyces griseosporeus]|uniref:hypothetical protein n=1 Tax=Streptomyces griseosporeus TaxID=1910 RepID=UPI0036F74316